MGHLLEIDGVARAWVVAHRWSALDGLMWVLSVLGRAGMIWVAIGAVLAVARRIPTIALIQLRNVGAGYPGLVRARVALCIYGAISVLESLRFIVSALMSATSG